jgi:hypothetical protein
MKAKTNRDDAWRDSTVNLGVVMERSGPGEFVPKVQLNIRILGYVATTIRMSEAEARAFADAILVYANEAAEESAEGVRR